MAWWAAKTWHEMTSGIDCPMCADAHLPNNDHSDLVVERGHSYVRLHRNQSQAGYCVVIAKTHVVELHDMEPATLAGFWSDVAAVGRAVTKVFRPVKIDNLVMGHRCPHVHCHVYPQYENDDPFKNVDISAGQVRLDHDERARRIGCLRQQLVADSDVH